MGVKDGPLLVRAWKHLGVGVREKTGDWKLSGREKSGIGSCHQDQGKTPGVCERMHSNECRGFFPPCHKHPL